MEITSMAKMMKAAVVRTFGKPLTIEEVPIPTPKRATITCHRTA
jgi:D-arabinose 1-dehydrogenase-like Zn-dependent alcohol dehydrogenase